MRSYVSAIKAVLLNIGIEINEDRFLLSAITKACKSKYDRTSNKLPIRKGTLNMVLFSVNKLFPMQPYLGILYRAMLSTAYFGLFRIGEITVSKHVVKAKDVHIGLNKKKLMFVLHSSKTHCRSSKPKVIKINATKKNSEGLQTKEVQETARFCPFQLLQDYTGIRKKYVTNQEPFFVFKDRTGVLATQFQKVLKKTDENK